MNIPKKIKFKSVRGFKDQSINQTYILQDRNYDLWISDNEVDVNFFCIEEEYKTYLSKDNRFAFMLLSNVNGEPITYNLLKLDSNELICNKSPKNIKNEMTEFLLLEPEWTIRNNDNVFPKEGIFKIEDKEFSITYITD